jgi:sugar lactone lactonase YvrE
VLLVGLERRLVTFELLSGAIEEVAFVTDDRRCVINEGLAVPGGVLFGTKNLTFDTPIAELYFFDSVDCTVRSILGGQICSNGKHFYDNNGTAYLADICSFQQAITRYRIGPSWTLETLDKIVDVTGQGIYPDGMRPSGDSLIVAFYDPRPVPNGCSRRYSIATGELLDEWVLEGSPRVTCPEFVRIGGETRLLFTTAIEGMPPEIRALAPRAGHFFLADAAGLSAPPPPPLVAA